MNSQDDFPFESFGLDPSIPDSHPQARRKRELADLVSTVIALDQSRPLRPRKNSLEVIVGKISSRPSTSLQQRSFAWTGWAAAAAMAILFIMQDHSSTIATLSPNNQNHTSSIKTTSPHASNPHVQAVTSAHATDESQSQSSQEGAATANMREQQRSLIQEIETLRKEVVLLASRDAQRLVARDGISWPIIMKLTAPGTDPLAVVVKDPVLGAMFDVAAAERGATVRDPLNAGSEANAVTPNPALPSAVPIYDPARDSGQLLINNLDAPAAGQAYFLWVQSDNSNQPVLVGSLPENFASSETFDFRLGAVGIIPDRFLITQDSQSSPSSPNASNTILRSPDQAPK